MIGKRPTPNQVMWWIISDKHGKDHGLNKKIEVKPVNPQEAICCINNCVIEPETQTDLIYV